MNIDVSAAVIVETLRRGALAVVPTDTVYGFAADPSSESAMAALYLAKGRPEGVPVAVLVDSIEQADSLVYVDEMFRRLADLHWPGALTIVANARSGNGLHIGTDTTVGVRQPNHALMRTCARLFGPIAATSANRHGEPTLTDPARLSELFGSTVELIVDDGLLRSTASTVVDITSGRVVVLRQGALQIDSDG